MINIAVIGAGRMGQIYCHNVSKNEHCKLVYVVSRTLESASKLAHKYQANACTEISVAINNEAIDAIIIASPTPTHLDIVTMAAKAGKAVFCEKPSIQYLLCWVLTAASTHKLANFDKPY